MSRPAVQILNRIDASSLWVRAGAFFAALVCDPRVAAPMTLPGPEGVRIVIAGNEAQAIAEFERYVSAAQPTNPKSPSRAHTEEVSR